MIFVVAEIGVNWDGDFTLLEQMMLKSKEIGFNAVKFQAFNENLIKDHPEASRLIKTAISEKNIEKVDELAKLSEIEWFCTPMYPKAVEFLEPYVKRFKIRALDGKSMISGNPSEIVEKILQTKKPIIVSSETNPFNTKFYGEQLIDWLYCVSKYPCELTDLDFSEMSYFSGYSNHCPNIIAPLTAAILGAKIIEIHVTADKSKKFVDNPVSFEYKDQNKLVKAIRDIEKMKIN
jgi:sialic acid synthase SpsE